MSDKNEKNSKIIKKGQRTFNNKLLITIVLAFVSILIACSPYLFETTAKLEIKFPYSIIIALLFFICGEVLKISYTQNHEFSEIKQTSFENISHIFKHFLIQIKNDCPVSSICNKELCNKTKDNCLFKDFFYYEIDRIHDAWEDLFKKYKLDSNRGFVHIKVFKYLKQLGIVRYRVIHYLGKDEKFLPSHFDKDFFRNLVAPENINGLKVEWLFVTENNENDFAMYKDKFQYIIQAVERQKVQASFSFKSTTLKTFQERRTLETFLHEFIKHIPDVGIYGEKFLFSYDYGDEIGQFFKGSRILEESNRFFDHLWDANLNHELKEIKPAELTTS
jgi:hypothetical protein